MTTQLPPALLGRQILWLRDEKAANTAGGTSVATTWTKRVCGGSTPKHNSIPGASFASDVFTLPKGTYVIRSLQTFYQPNAAKGRLRNTTDGVSTIVGSNGYSSTSNNDVLESHVNGIFTITATKNFELQYWVANAVATNGLGILANAGEVEVYVDIIIEKIA